MGVGFRSRRFSAAWGRSRRSMRRSENLLSSRAQRGICFSYSLTSRSLASLGMTDGPELTNDKRRTLVTRYIATVLLCAVAATASAQLQTGDRAKRGLAATDFPRAKQLEPGVYSYEALRAGDPGGQMTTVSLIVITNDGVLVADGQGNVDQTREMVTWIAKTTNQPIKYVVICSDHGDHTGGNAAFPAG